MTSARHLVVIGASAGGIETLRELVARLPADFPAAIAIVLHTSAESPGVLPEILSRSGPLTAVGARNLDRLRPGTIFVAPPDHHLLIEPGHVRVTKGPRENRFRPAIDPLFRTAAQVFGPAAIGVILTGNLDDGAAGLYAIKQLGGIAIVQHPDDALYPSMPRSALQYVKADYCVPLSEIAPLLARITQAPVAEQPAAIPDQMEIEVNIAKEEDPLKAGVGRLGEPSAFSCPECHGVLLQVKEGGHIRFRCHTGHAYSPESLLAEIRESIEAALWETIRAMQEGQLLMGQLARHVESAHPTAPSGDLRHQEKELGRKADVLRDMVTSPAEVATPKA